MNKTIKKLAVALTVCGALCGAANAAHKAPPQVPRNNKPPAVQQAPRQVAQRHDWTAPGQRVSSTKVRSGYCVVPAAQPAPRPEPRRELAGHKPEPPRAAPRHSHPAPPPPPARHHHNSTIHGEDWCSMGASLIGGLIGGMIGGAL